MNDKKRKKIKTICTIITKRKGVRMSLVSGSGGN